MRYLHLMVACVLPFVLSVGTADIPEPSAILTWDRYDIVENLDCVPDDPVFLYITLYAVPDIETVSFETVWSPWSPGGGCYEMLSLEPAGACGWLEGEGAQALSDNIEATRTIHFDTPPGNGSCIRLAFTSNGRETDRRATFCLRNFKITDLRGQESFLCTPNVATILGGVDLQLPQYIRSIEPATIRAGSETRLRVLGGHFSEPVQVYLKKVDSRRVIGLPMQAISSEGFSCAGAPAPADTGRWIVAARNGDGFVAVAPETIVVLPRSSGIANFSAGLGPNPLSLRCYPNPAGNWTDVSFSLPQPAEARIFVHDSAGRLVRLLMDGAGKRGANNIRWDCRTSSGSDAAAGVYLVSVESGEIRATAKLTIAR